MKTIYRYFENQHPNAFVKKNFNEHLCVSTAALVLPLAIPMLKVIKAKKINETTSIPRLFIGQAPRLAKPDNLPRSKNEC